MRITQGYVSKSVMSFPFHEIYALDDYNNQTIPSVFFGMYRFEDYKLLEFHSMFQHAITFWTGQDVLQWSDDHLRFIHELSNTKTAHPKVQEYLKSKGRHCELVKPSTFLNSVQPQKLGPRIYAYCPNSAPDYHGKKVLDELRCAGYEIIIGDGTIPQHLWKHSASGFYNDIFIGLCLSEFAGGGTSIIEMGLRGIPVVTNVFKLPNCLPWRDAQDIANTIEQNKTYIGLTKKRLAQDVWDELDHEHKWLDYD